MQVICPTIEDFAPHALWYERDVVIITDGRIFNLYADIIAYFRAQTRSLTVYIAEEKEGAKTLASLSHCHQYLCQHHDRQVMLIALGGGSLCDFTGCVAATFYRGVDVVYLPTTLLAMVDAAIGGKCAVNTSCGKNTFGMIRSPQLTIIHYPFLATLSAAQKREGLVESIKHALIASESLMEQILALHGQPDNVWDKMLPQIITDSAQIKAEIVANDLHEHQQRYLLNFGHTIGHAIEFASGYTLSHGDSVALGMMIEASIARQLGMMTDTAYQRIGQLLVAIDALPTWPESLAPAAVIAALSHDKKRANQQIRMTMITATGTDVSSQKVLLQPVDQDLVRAMIDAFIAVTQGRV